jgi:disulfide bond formation protein DsbB
MIEGEKCHNCWHDRRMTGATIPLWDRIRAEPLASAAAAVAIVGVATIAGAYFFQYVLGLPPCPLCLEQRVAYYVSIPLAAMILLGLSVGASRKVLLLAFLAIAAAMLWNAGLVGADHELRPGGRPAGAHREHPRGALRRGRMALSRPVACGL